VRFSVEALEAFWGLEAMLTLEPEMGDVQIQH
jgi:hypothetical protein